MRSKFYILLLLLPVILILGSCYAIRAYKFRKLKTMDHERLPYLTIAAGGSSYQYAEQKDDRYATVSAWLDTTLQNTLTHAFLVIKNDTVVYEKYNAPYTRTTLLPSFSVAKSYVATLVAIAYEEGKIKSLSQPVTDYIPELLKTDARYANITIQHLLDMRSGIKWNEGDYGLKDDAIKMGFRPNMLPHVLKTKIETSPAADSNYKSINTMLLGLVLKKATGKPLTQYLQEKLWQPLGMESNATWNTDKHKLPITYGGLNATARDFAKLGSLYLKNGNWGGKQIISAGWVNASVSSDSMKYYGGYRNQFWGVTDYSYHTDSLEAVGKSNGGIVKSYKAKNGNRYFYFKKGSSRFYAEGILGQFVYVVPEKNIVIVRLGYSWSHPKYYITSLFEELWRKY
jgi:CubicO group peptidase (beta-lactamase class C family)